MFNISCRKSFRPMPSACIALVSVLLPASTPIGSPCLAQCSALWVSFLCYSFFVLFSSLLCFSCFLVFLFSSFVFFSSLLFFFFLLLFSYLVRFGPSKPRYPKCARPGAVLQFCHCARFSFRLSCSCSGRIWQYLAGAGSIWQDLAVSGSICLITAYKA